MSTSNEDAELGNAAQGLPNSAGDDEDLEVEGKGETGREADRRRYRILRMLLDPKRTEPRLTVADLRGDRKFTRAFTHVADATLEDDLRHLERLFGGGRALRIQRDGAAAVRVLRGGDSSFAHVGYRQIVPGEPLTTPDDLRADAKRRIGEYIVRELIRDPIEVLYLSTGTTVFQVAVALLASAVTNVAVVLTDNAAIFELFCQRAASDPRLLMCHLEVLGGQVRFDHGDIAQEHAKEFGPWKCSKALISVTGVGSRDGQLYSFREPETKASVLKKLDMPEVIIPVLPERIGQAGGRLIYDPSQNAREGRAYHIVTTHLEPQRANALQEHGYVVHMTDKNVAK